MSMGSFDVIVANRLQELERTLKRFLSRPSFEYKVVPMKKENMELDSFEEQLKTLGNEGWELVSVSDAVLINGKNLIFKRRRT